MNSNAFEQMPEQSSVALLTPTYARDLSLCALLCESVDRHARSFSKHYLLVPDSDLALFSHFEGPQRTVLSASQFLPGWLRPLPSIIRRQRRQHWWSLRARPVSGWHIQQILKIAAAATLAHSRFCIFDSDVVLFRDFDLAPYRFPELLPLHRVPNGITPGHVKHARWIETTHRMLGLPTPSLPATDFIGHIIFWDQLAIRGMIRKIESTTGLGWIEALCRTREFSEYLLYGYFVQSEAPLRAMHEPTLSTGCISYWDQFKLDKAALTRLLGAATANDFAFSAASFSETSPATIREVIDDQRGQTRMPIQLREPAGLGAR
ncbi:hypothetical protein SAMN05444170_1385 [Bradyrhizobium erythrophlei]|jgi:hypothetical protein|uniref:Glycosyl transferase family 8 n=2 Tax=Bradyrhizobium erythrophlei TaxID=1437360 RepID=A0A1M7TD48_9BRAD|nr:hypothetical protein SAMN05444170_1385 [Bradyrhizobium erythrophlei]